ncbi:hypothetical protein TKK_0003597 [Trichogramma kaykai]
MAVQKTQAELAELSRQLDFEENQFYWLKKFLKFVFLCPVQPKAIQKSRRAMMHARFIFAITITCTRAYKELVINEIYPPMLAELAFQFIVALGTYFVYLQAIDSEKVLYRMCEVVTIDWLGISDLEEKDTMKVVCKRGSRLILIHFGLLLPVFACYALGPVALPYVLNPYLPENMTLQKTLCVHVELFIDQEKYFYYILAFSIHILIIVMLIICALDLSYTSCITYVMGKIIWIGYIFEKLCEIKTSNQNLSAKRKIDTVCFT